MNHNHMGQGPDNWGDGMHVIQGPGSDDLIRAGYGRAAAPAPAPQPAAPVQQGATELPNSIRVPLDSLHADAAYLIGRLLSGSMTAQRVVEIIRERIDAAKAALSHPVEAQQAASDLPMTCRHSNRTDCALYEPTQRPSREWYGKMIRETEGLDDALPRGALAQQAASGGDEPPDIAITHPAPTAENAGTIMFGLADCLRSVAQVHPNAICNGTLAAVNDFVVAASRAAPAAPAVEAVTDGEIMRVAGECFADENTEFTGEMMEFARAVIALALARKGGG